jgi:Tfp pilus assembly protein PilE
VADLLAAVGPELTFVEDDAGTYAALRLRDAARFDAALKQLASATGGSYETRDIGGTAFHSLTLPGIAALGNDSNASGAADSWLPIYARLGYHYYWIEQDGAALTSQIPQTLMDYRSAKTHTDLNQWLTKVQNVDAAQSLFAFTLKTHDTQRSAYAAYLGLLQALGDGAGAKLDMYTLPSADALQLPRQGLLGTQLHASADDIGLDLIYQQTPYEIVGSSSFTSLAVAGMLAAVALPAYQDYTVKAHVAAAHAAAAAMQQSVEAYYAKHHKMPRSADDLDMDGSAMDLTYISAIQFEDNAIAVTLDTSAGAQVDERVLMLSAYRGADGTLLWQCGNAPPPAQAKALGADSGEGTSVDEKYLPAACRP